MTWMRNWANIALFVLIFFYAWQMTNIFGFVPGLHLCGLALGFFCLATPFLSIFTMINAFFGQRAFSIAANISLVIFFVLLLLVTVTFKSWPGLFHWTGITSLFFRIFKMDVVYKLFGVSFSGVATNFLLARLGERAHIFTVWMTVLLTLILCVVFYSLLPEAREAVVIDINGAIDNF